MSISSEDKYGTIKVSEDVVAVCAMNAAQKTEGVYDLAQIITDSISNMLGKEALYKGIRVTQDDEGIIIDVYVIVNYGVKIPEVAWNVQENVKTEVEHMLDVSVSAINIHVQGVHYTQPEEN